MWAVTVAGRDVWETQDAAIPEQYRRLLWCIDVQGAPRAIEELLRENPERLVRDWLQELAELGLIESRPAGADIDKTVPLAIEPLMLKRAAEAATALTGAGAYLADTSPKPPKAKPRGQTTILIVEDDADQLALANLRASAAGYRVRTARSVAGLTKHLLLEDLPDLLLLDVLLPDGNGFDVVPKIRRHLSFARLPIVMLTVMSDPEHIAAGLALGVNGYITKPYSKNILVSVLKGVLGE